MVLSLHVAIDSQLPIELEFPAVAFGSFVSKHPGVIVYDETPESSPLARFYIDLISGRPLPLQYVTRQVDSIASVVSVVLHMDRASALHPRMHSLVTSVELVSAMKEAGMAHIDRDLSRLLLFIDQYLFEQPATKQVLEERLPLVIDWLRGWVFEERLPSLPAEPPPPRVLDYGTNGFVVAEGSRPNEDVVELYRMGYLRGVLYSRDHVLAFRKSRHLQFDLAKAAGMLNAVARELGQPENWVVEGLFLRGTSQLSREKLTEVFLRI